MRFDLKASITFTVIVVIGFVVLNSVSFLYYKEGIKISLLKEAKAYYELKKKEPLFPLPYYLKMYKELIFQDDFVPLIKIEDTNVYVKRDYIERKFNNFFINIFLWDVVIIFTLYIFFYFTILRYIKKETEIKSILEIFTLSISHKLGNFLSINKMNIELLKSKCKFRELERIEQSYNLLEKDFINVSSFLKNIGKTDKKRVLNLRTLIERHLNEFQSIFPDKRIILSLRDIYVKAEEDKLSLIIFNLLENAFKYSDSFIHIKTCQNKRKVTLSIRNDISTDIKRTTGIGLEIVTKLLKDTGGVLWKKAGKDTYTVVVLINR